MLLLSKEHSVYRLSFSERLDRRHPDRPTGRCDAGQQRCHSRHGKHNAVDSPFEWECHGAVQTEHHVCAQPTEQCAKQYAGKA